MYLILLYVGKLMLAITKCLEIFMAIPAQTLAGQSAFMLLTMGTSQFSFSGPSSKDDRAAQAGGVPRCVTSTERAESPQTSPGTLTSAGKLQSFQLCLGCIDDSDFLFL